MNKVMRYGHVNFETRPMCLSMFCLTPYPSSGCLSLLVISDKTLKYLFVNDCPLCFYDDNKGFFNCIVLTPRVGNSRGI